MTGRKYSCVARGVGFATWLIWVWLSPLSKLNNLGKTMIIFDPQFLLLQKGLVTVLESEEKITYVTSVISCNMTNERDNYCLTFVNT